MGYKITALSPTHIYSGDICRPINYMVDKDNYLFIFDEIDVINSVKESELLNDELLRNLSLTSKREEYYKNLDYFIDKGIVDENIFTKYKVKASNKVENIKGKEIYRTMRNIQGILIPGSTIKGTIRTAVFYDYLVNKGIDYIKEAVNILKDRKNYRMDIDDYVLYGSYNGRIKQDISKDPFRFLSVKDINMIKSQVDIYEESIYNINSFFSGNVVETIREKNFSEEFDFEIRTNKKTINRYKKDIIKYFNEEEILRVLYEYGKDIIEDEIEYFEKHKNPLLNSKELIEFLQDIQRKNSKKSPIIRIGKSTGYKSHTIALAIKKLEKNYYLKEIKRIAKPLIARTFKYDKRYEFPKTRKIVGSPISPKLLGFAIVEKVD